MAIAFDAKSEDYFTGGTSGTTITVSHTCTGSDRILLVGAWVGAGTDTITGATYNGVSMTEINAVTTGFTTVKYTKLFYLIAPAIGANNIVVTKSGTNSAYIWIRNASYTGVKQSAQPDSQTTNTASGVTSLGTSTTTVADNSWVIAFTAYDSIASNSTAGSGTTIRTNGGNQWADFFDSGSAITPAGSKTLNVDRGDSGDIVMNVASISPVSDVPTFIPKMMIF